jgi:hypothetical protein
VRKHGRTDGPQKAMVAELRRLGFSVAVTSAVGDGFPDLLVGGHYRTIVPVNLLIEIKRDKKAKLTPDQVEFFKQWRGPKIVATSTEDVLKWFGVAR